MQRGRYVATHREVGVRRKGCRDGEHVVVSTAEGLEGQATIRRVRILQKFLSTGQAFVTEIRQEPDGAGSDVGVAVLGEFKHRGQSLNAEALRSVEAEVTDIDGRAAQSIDRASRTGEVELRDDGLEALRGDAVDCAGAGVIERLVTAHARVEPIGNVDGPIGTNGDVRRTEPNVFTALTGGLDAMEVRAFEFARRIRSDKVLTRGFVQGEGTLLRLQLVGEDRIAGRFAIQERAVERRAERAVFINGNPRR